MSMMNILRRNNEFNTNENDTVRDRLTVFIISHTEKDPKDLRSYIFLGRMFCQLNNRYVVECSLNTLYFSQPCLHFCQKINMVLP